MWAKGPPWLCPCSSLDRLSLKSNFHYFLLPMKAWHPEHLLLLRQLVRQPFYGQKGIWEHLRELSFTTFIPENLNYCKIQWVTCAGIFTVLAKPVEQKCWCVLPYKIAQTDSWAAVTSGALNSLPLAPLLAVPRSWVCSLSQIRIHFFPLINVLTKLI